MIRPGWHLHQQLHCLASWLRKAEFSIFWRRSMFIVSGPNASSEVKYLITLAVVVVLALLAKNIVRGMTGRAWMAIRDFDIAAEIIGIRPLLTKLAAFAISSFYCGVAGALYVFTYVGNADTEAFDLIRSFTILFMVIIGGLGLGYGVLSRRCVYRAVAADTEYSRFPLR